jgi:quercetin 2,3-dioxygenase
MVRHWRSFVDNVSSAAVIIVALRATIFPHHPFVQARRLAMITVRNAAERGATRLGWLDSRHSFSFGGYHDEAHMGFGPLRVINDDRVAPCGGFAPHGHRDMEIISYVLDGALAHKDSLGTGSVIRAGEIQRMSAGTGIRHSEFNASSTEPVHFLQIWIVPERQGLAPSYAETVLPAGGTEPRLHRIAGKVAGGGVLGIHADAEIYAAGLRRGEAVEHALAKGRIGWLQVVRGAVALNGRRLAAGDGAAIEDETELAIEGLTDGEVLLFDMAGPAQ